MTNPRGPAQEWAVQQRADLEGWYADARAGLGLDHEADLRRFTHPDGSEYVRTDPDEFGEA